MISTACPCTIRPRSSSTFRSRRGASPAGSASPTLYVIVHGFGGSGFTEAVLLDSTPGNPAKWWNTTDSNWILNGVSQVSARGSPSRSSPRTLWPRSWAIAGLMIRRLPAQPPRPHSRSTATSSRVAPVLGVDTTNLLPGMTVSGSGIPRGYSSVHRQPTQLTLSVPATAALPPTSRDVCRHQRARQDAEGGHQRHHHGHGPQHVADHGRHDRGRRQHSAGSAVVAIPTATSVTLSTSAIGGGTVANVQGNGSQGIAPGKYPRRAIGSVHAAQWHPPGVRD